MLLYLYLLSLREDLSNENVHLVLVRLDAHSDRALFAAASDALRELNDAAYRVDLNWSSAQGSLPYWSLS
jgi:hypothetical protein